MDLLDDNDTDGETQVNKLDYENECISELNLERDRAGDSRRHEDQGERRERQPRGPRPRLQPLSRLGDMYTQGPVQQICKPVQLLAIFFLNTFCEYFLNTILLMKLLSFTNTSSNRLHTTLCNILCDTVNRTRLEERLESRHKIHLDRLNHGHCVKEKIHMQKKNNKSNDKTDDKTRQGEQMRSGTNQHQWTSPSTTSPSSSSSFESRTT